MNEKLENVSNNTLPGTNIWNFPEKFHDCTMFLLVLFCSEKENVKQLGSNSTDLSIKTPKLKQLYNG